MDFGLSANGRLWMVTRVLTRRGFDEAALRAAGGTMLGATAVLLGMALAAQVRIPAPGTPVPFTLQTLALLLFTLAFPRGAAAAGMTAYLALGAAGLPVFQPGSLGLAGPTGGYLVGFLLSTPVVGALRGGPREGLLRLHWAAGAGIGIVLLCGSLWLSFWQGRWALAEGLRPFAVKAMIEVCLAAWLVFAGRGAVSAWRRHGKPGS